MDEPEIDDDSVFGRTTPDSFFFSAIGFEAGLGVLAIILGLIFGPQANLTVPLLADWQAIIWGLALGCLCALPMVAVVAWLQTLDVPAVHEINDFSKDNLLPMMRQLSMPELAAVALCAGVGEELLFRGWLQMLLTGPGSEWTATSIVIGIGLASLAFGMAHAITRLYVLVVFLMGILFGALLVVTGNLLVPIAAHALFDFIQLVRVVREPIDEDAAAEC